MGERNFIHMLLDAIDKANASKTFTENSLFLEVEENVIDMTVCLLVNKNKIVTIKRVSVYECYTELLKWLIVAGVPIFNDMNLFVDGDSFVIKPKD